MIADTVPYAVVALIFDGEGNVLSVSRRNKPDDIGLPGGKVDPGETANQAILREVREETGLVIVEWPQLFFMSEEEGRPVWCYWVTRTMGRARAMEDGFKVRWVRPEALLDSACTYHRYNRELFKKVNLCQKSAEA